MTFYKYHPLRFFSFLCQKTIFEWQKSKNEKTEQTTELTKQDKNKKFLMRGGYLLDDRMYADQK